MERKIREPFTLGKHDRLTQKMNEFVIAAKLHHTSPPEREEKKENWEKAMSNYECPTWSDAIDLIREAIGEMDKCRVNPVNY